jgi:1-acyl-sn-glycerol-3-phosphate acyltransferase
LAHWIAIRWARTLLFLAGVRVSISGRKGLSGRESYIFASNHLSAVDILVLLARMPVPFRWLAKDSLFKIPIFGWAMKQAGYIPVEREQGRSAYQSLERAAERIRDGVSVIIFPEGTRSRDGKLGPFKGGGFVLAIKSGRPMVPVSIRGSYEILPKGRYRITPGRVRVVLGRPVPTDGFKLKERGKLMDQVRKEIIKGYDQ